METSVIDDVEINLSQPSDLEVKWVGQEHVKNQLLAAWLVLNDSDVPLTPRLIGLPGVGKTTLAYTTAKELGREIYFIQATMDTRPEDLIISPVIGENQTIRYVASPLVTAMIKGGVLILDEGNRMPEKSWASLAPLLDQRRYVESQLAGITIHAHPNFRMVTTMNTDPSTFELPEYILSRLQPLIELDFPSKEEEKRILKLQVPFADDEIIDMVSAFLSAAHLEEKPFTVRSGIQILRYALKLKKVTGQSQQDCLYQSIDQILGEDALDLI